LRNDRLQRDCLDRFSRRFLLVLVYWRSTDRKVTIPNSRANPRFSSSMRPHYRPGVCPSAAPWLSAGAVTGLGPKKLILAELHFCG
jgi:hypothetical protein